MGFPYYADEAPNNYGTIPLRGPNGLGTSFVIPGQDNSSNSTGYPNSRAMFVSNGYTGCHPGYYYNTQ